MSFGPTVPSPARLRPRSTRRAFLLATLLLPACNLGVRTTASTPPVTPTTRAASPTTAPVALPPTPTAFPATPPLSPAPPTPTATPAPTPSGPVELRVETVVGGLEAPWEVAFAPDGRLLLTERPGRVRLVRDGQLVPEPVLTLPVAATGEAGLLGLALHPDFPTTPWVYLYYTYSEGDRLWNRVVRCTAMGDRLVDPVVVIDRIPGATIHDGGRIAFGPDGKLYVTTGDAREPTAAQDLNSLAGKILRLEPDGSVPADNPFPGSPVWSYGHRNPQGLAWTSDGRLYATEHGPTGDLGLAAHDEVNAIEPGRNYGWPFVVGTLVRQALPDAVPPVIESGTATWAPSGATFVRSGRIPQWQGNLLFAGLRSQTLWRLVLSPDGRSAELLEPLYRGEFGRLRTVVEGPDGALYLLTSNRDGRGSPRRGDDRLLRIAPQ
ncbi:MAG: PQQ-dependent sugar dehydrogenase [Thermomicrobium sp.]|nr:PQQ-dependent sugar dehydrogenase [Thermomicrobium sp.]